MFVFKLSQTIYNVANEAYGMYTSMSFNSKVR